MNRIKNQIGIGIAGTLTALSIGSALLYGITSFLTYKDVGEIKYSIVSQVEQLLKTTGGLVKAGRFSCTPAAVLRISLVEDFYTPTSGACNLANPCKGFTIMLKPCLNYYDDGNANCPISLTLTCPTPLTVTITPKIAGISVPILNIGAYAETFTKE